MKVLLIQQKYMGDVLMMSVVANNIKRQFPESEVYLFCYSNNKSIIETNPNIDFILHESEQNLKKVSVLIRFIKYVRSQKYDFILDPYSKMQSKLICLFSTAKYRISYQKRKSIIPYYNNYIEPKDVAPTTAKKAIDERLALGSVFWKKIPDLLEPQLHLTANEIENGKRILEENQVDFNKPLLMIGALGSKEEKTYPLEYMGDLINFVCKNHEIQLLFNYIPKQLPEIEKLMQFIKFDYHSKINLNVIGKSIREFASIVHHCDLHISNEGGGCHISKAVNVPTFTIFSPYIEKNAWDSFVNEQNQSVHLNDYLTRDQEDDNQKKIRKESLALYKKLKFELFQDKLSTFIRVNL